jgi:hypothetical protein
MLIRFLDGSAREIANLSGANLSGANLAGADLTGAYLAGTYLTGADLTGAYLTGAYLTGAYLAGAYLSGAYLSGADLRGADLTGANLTDANLTDANLTGANLTDANLTGAYLRRAYLTGAYLRRAYLTGAYLSGAKGLEQFCILPAGDLIVWKQVSNGIAKLLVPAKAARVNSYGSRKCRAAYAKVLSAPKGAYTAAHSPLTKYMRGRIVRPDKFDPDPRIECSHGIHFFITEQEAQEYGS